MMKKKRKKTRKKIIKVNLSKKGKIILVGITLLILLIMIMTIRGIMGNYGGLGLSKVVKENPYETSGFYREDGFKKYKYSQYKSYSGIDVSAFQKEIDWEKVKASGVDFAMIRVGYRGTDSGEITIDSYFKDNVKGARKAGVDIGVYFFSQAVTPEEAIEEARFVIRHIRGKNITYPVVFDMEPVDGSNRIADLTASQKTEIADAFCKVIERNGYSPMIYGNQTWLYGSLNLEYLTDYETWLAHYAADTDYGYEHSMWQYTDSGIIPGISGNVDINIYFVKK